MGKVRNVQRAKIVAAFFLLAALAITAMAVQQTPIASPVPFTNTLTQPTTQKQPTINNLTDTMFWLRLSALDNLTLAQLISLYNELFFEGVLPSTTEVTNLSFASVCVFSNMMDEFNASVPEPIWPAMPFPTFMNQFYQNMNLLTPFAAKTLNGTGAAILLIFNDTSSATQNLCNTTLTQTAQRMMNKLSQKGLQGVKTLQPRIMIVSNVYIPTSINQIPPDFASVSGTAGIMVLTVENTSMEVYDLLSADLPDGYTGKNITQKARSATHRGITLGDMALTNKNASWSEIESILRGVITKNGQTYSFSLKKMLDLPAGNNITATERMNIMLTVPTNCNITKYYPQLMPPQGMPPGLCTLMVPAPINYEDINVTYQILDESEIPYAAIVDYKMINESGQIDWNPDPRETVNLTLTVKNVGQGNITGQIWVAGRFYDTSVANFTNSGNSTGVSINGLNAGETATVQFNITAIKTGVAKVMFSCMFSSPPIGFTSDVRMDIVVGYAGPILVPLVDWSNNWLASPGEEFNLLVNFTNYGADAQNFNATFMAMGYIVTQANVSTTFTTISDIVSLYEVTLLLGDIPHGDSVIVNITMINDPFMFAQTGMPNLMLFFRFNNSLEFTTVIPGQLPGARPDSSLFLEVEIDPEIIEGNPGDEVDLTITVRNLGLTSVEVTLEALIPEGCELVEGEVNGTITVAPGEEVVLVCTVRITGTSGASSTVLPKANEFRALIPLPSVNVFGEVPYGWGYLGLTGTPLEFCSAVQVSLPSGASLNISLTSEAEVTAIELSVNPAGVAPSGVELLDWFLNVTVTNPSAFENMTITVHYDEAAVISAGLDEASLRIYVWDGTHWIELQSTVDTENNTITATVTHLSYFAIGAPAQEAALAVLLIPILTSILNTQATNLLPVIIAIGAAEGAALTVAIWLLKRKP